MLWDGIRYHFPPIVGTQGRCVRKDEMHQMIVETPHCDVSTDGGDAQTVTCLFPTLGMITFARTANIRAEGGGGTVKNPA